MAAKDTWRWVKTEWGIIAQRDQMTLSDTVRWLRQWVPFGARTIAYGTLSLTVGPFTRDFAASAWAQKRWSQASMAGLRIAVECEGAERVPAGGVLYASNHQSLLDILVLGAVLPGDLKWATKRAIMKVPFLGWHLTMAGHVPVDRRAGKVAADRTIDGFVDVLERGKPLLVFPEGTRSEDGDVKPFRNGAFIAAVRAGKPVCPVAIEGTYRLMRKHAVDTGEMAQPRDRERLVRVEVGEPLTAPAHGDFDARMAALRDATQAAVTTLHRRLRDRARP
jgi:1-acyl-sn-glycerol-3-phosphate acyltransferase